MKPKHYLVSFGMAVVLVFVSQFIMVDSGNAACMSGNTFCASRDDYFNQYGWPFAFRSVANITDMNSFSEYHPGMMVLDIILAFTLIVVIAFIVTKFKQRQA